jgi:hypothetical protein
MGKRWGGRKNEKNIETGRARGRGTKECERSK